MKISYLLICKQSFTMLKHGKTALVIFFHNFIYGIEFKGKRQIKNI